MRRTSPISVLLYNAIFPKPTASDPPNFSNHLARNLVPEIRVETARFYGSLDSIEARYPGLNYCHAPHRMRLSRFPHHARLFRAIAALGLTDSEVLDLVRWEGTLWARERFERDENVRVRDTTGDGIAGWLDPRAAARRGRGGIKVETAVEIEVEEVHVAMSVTGHEEAEVLDRVVRGGGEDEEMSDAEGGAAADDDDDVDGDDEDDHDDDEIGDAIQSIGLDLNRRLLAAVAARQQGQNVEMDPEFEEYLKQQVENGALTGPLFANNNTLLQAPPPRRPDVVVAASILPSILAPALTRTTRSAA